MNRETLKVRSAVEADCPGLGRVQLDSWHTTAGAEIKPATYWAHFSYSQREQLGGQPLGQDSTDLDGVEFIEVAYGWLDIETVIENLGKRLALKQETQL